MKYTMNAGILYRDHSSVPLAKIKGSLLGPEKNIYLQDDNTALKTDICSLDEDGHVQGDARNRLYLLRDGENHTIVEGHPDYAAGEDPDIAGWPLCRLPRVDHAQIDNHGETYTLTMHDSSNYSLLDEKGCEILHIMHRGICGGWLFEDEHGFDSATLCGLFVFCRYMEQENEFLVV